MERGSEDTSAHCTRAHWAVQRIPLSAGTEPGGVEWGEDGTLLLFSPSFPQER